jgi:probable F420-dependent oxidoreductase
MNDRASLVDLARRVEANGFDALYVSDHPGVVASPFAVLATAACATSTLRLGTYVCNTGVREPVQLASDAATIDMLSEGRFIFGVGAGHTPAEWTMEGRSYPSASDRVGRFTEMVAVVVQLLSGEVVNFDGRFVRVRDGFLLTPRPIQPRLPVLVGGNGKKLLAETARYADVISLTGLGRTLADGHRHTADWTARAIDERIDVIRAAKPEADVVLDALVQVVETTNEPAGAAERVASAVPGLTPEDVLAAPFALFGSVESIADDLVEYEERWGISSYVVRDAAVDTMAGVIRRLNS